jgi:hypothetical protein
MTAAIFMYYCSLEDYLGDRVGVNQRYLDFHSRAFGLHYGWALDSIEV